MKLKPMKQIFINLPVSDINASMHFYEQAGFTVNPLFTFDDQKCMVWSDHIYVMLQTVGLFNAGNTKALADAKKNRIATFTLPVESPGRVNEIIEKGLRAGGTEPAAPVDTGFMQVRSIEDPDGHLWGVLFLELDKFKKMKGK